MGSWYKHTSLSMNTPQKGLQRTTKAEEPTVKENTGTNHVPSGAPETWEDIRCCTWLPPLRARGCGCWEQRSPARCPLKQCGAQPEAVRSVWWYTNPGKPRLKVYSFKASSHSVGPTFNIAPRPEVPVTMRVLKVGTVPKARWGLTLLKFSLAAGHG